MKKYLIAIAFITLNLVACASSGNGANNNSTATYANQPDSPTVSSRAASSEEFPEENKLTPNN